MKRRTFLALVLALGLLAPASGQNTAPVRQSGTDKDDVVRITTNLVQVDAIVTDKSGKHVTDLAPEDFQIFENGRPQQITNFSYVRTDAGLAAAPEAAAPETITAKKRAERGAPPVPPIRLRPEQVRRTIALVVDDLGLSFESTYWVRRALKKFVDEQVQDGDLVAIVRTGAGVGALQQFTSDKRVLYAAVERVKWNSRGRGGIAAFAAIGNDSQTISSQRGDGTYTPSSAGISAAAAGAERDVRAEAAARDSARRDVNDFNDEIFTVGTLGALNYVIRGLREMPGRKSIVLMSDSLAIFNSKGSENFRSVEAARKLTDLANRASVVIYTIDAKGLLALNDSAADGLVGFSRANSAGEVAASGLPGARIMADLAGRSAELLESQNGLHYLADQTGGFFFRNNNDLNLGIKRVLDDQKGYYLIGYRPDESTFDTKSGRRRFHSINIKVGRPGLSVRSRTGFFGISNEEARPVGRSREHQLIAAITSPFSSNAIDLRLTSLFFNDPQYGSYVRSLIYVDAGSLTFSEEADGSRKANVDVVAMTFNDDGMVVDQRFRTETIVTRGDEYRRAIQNGLIFGINLPVKQSGAFQLRIAVRDSASERVGSASQFIEVPNLEKKRLTLSGMYLASTERRAALRATENAATVETTGVGEGKIDELDPQSGPAVRRFKPNSLVDYGYEIYNPRIDKATRRPQLQTQVRLFHNNKLTFSGRAVNITGQPDAKRVVAFGRLQLGANMPSGEYILQVVVTDLLSNDNKNRMTTQWIEFEIK